MGLVTLKGYATFFLFAHFLIVTPRERERRFHSIKSPQAVPVDRFATETCADLCGIDSEINPGIKGLCVGAFSGQAMRDEKGAGLETLFCLRVGVNFCIVDPDNLVTHYDKVLPTVLLNQVFLVVFEVFKLLFQHDNQVRQISGPLQPAMAATRSPCCTASPKLSMPRSSWPWWLKERRGDEKVY